MLRNILILLVLCSYVGAASLLLPKYTHYSLVKTWADAQTYCRTHHTDLATIRSPEDYKRFMNAQVQGWIGLYQDDSSSPWKWSLRSEPANFTTWSGAKRLLTGNCGVQYPNENGWKNERCQNTHSFVCFDENLFLVKENKTWEEALAYCRSIQVIDPTIYNNHTFDLATLLTQDDYNFARELTQGATTVKVWNGLRFLGDVWAWAGGKEVQSSSYFECPAVWRCGILNNTVSIQYRTQCDLKYNFLCYRRGT